MTAAPARQERRPIVPHERRTAVVTKIRGVAFEERDYGVAWSIYMSDPDGHLVEITTYEVTRG